MKNIATLLATLFFLSGPVLADREFLNGSWHSSSGAFIVVGPTTENDTFVMNVYRSATSNELIPQIEAEWFDGPNFVYKVNNEQIVGVYLREQDSVEVYSRDGDWTLTWRRD